MYEVEKIVSSRVNKSGKNQYFVKWVGYDSSQNTWQPQKNLVTVKDLLQKYQASNGKNNSEKASTQKKSSDNDSQSDDHENDVSLGSFGQNSPKQQKASDKGLKNDSKQGAKKQPGPTSKKIVRNIATKQEPEKQTKKIAIVGISTDGTGKFVYKILIDGAVKWVKRSFLVPLYLNELCEFYQQNLVLKQ